jgi:hypothetical protein
MLDSVQLNAAHKMKLWKETIQYASTMEKYINQGWKITI